MNDTYKVYIKTTDKANSEDVETLVEFECDRARYEYEIEKALKNGLSFTASNTVYDNDRGGKNYFVIIYIW